MDKVSVIIPARNEVLLQKTIDSVLEAAVEDVEVIAVCDGYRPDPPLTPDSRVIPVYNPESIGQRQSINLAAERFATGKWIMKLDAHCSVASGFDKVLKEDCKPEWTMVPRMYVLDPVKWEPKLNKKTDYMYISGPEHKKEGKDYGFRAMYYGKYAGAVSSRPRSSKQIDETMCCMGPGWFLHRDRFLWQGGCDTGHGGWGQQGVEVALKAWLSGGALVVNKKTWFAHWFRGGVQPEGLKKGFPYRLTGRDQQNARKYSKDLWLNNKWDRQLRTVEWLVEKFNPPTWNGNGAKVINHEERMKLFAPMYNHIHRRKNDASWKGLPLWKFPTDMSLYHEVIFERQPDWIVEIGTAKGGSAVYFQDMLDLTGNGGRVVTLDIRDRLETKRDPRIQYIIGNSKDEAVVERVRDMVNGKVMVVVDGNHERTHVKWDLHNFSPMVTKGQFLVVEDCYNDRGLFGPGEAKEWFLERHSEFKQTDRDQRYLVGMTMDGWLERT